MLGYGIRSGVDVLVLILRHSRKRRLDPRAVLYALFGPDSLRMGCLLGGFSFLYKQALYVLYKFNPGHKGKRHEEPWHAAVAGALSGLAVLAEKHSRRITIGQQLAVRGLQGYYNGAKARGWVNIPHGDVLVFGLASAQIVSTVSTRTCRGLRTTHWPVPVELLTDVFVAHVARVAAIELSRLDPERLTREWRERQAEPLDAPPQHL